MLSEEVVCGCLPNKQEQIFYECDSVAICLFLSSSQREQQPFQKFFLVLNGHFVSSFGYDFSSQIAFTPGDVFLSLSVDDRFDTEIMPGVFDDVDF